MPNIFVKHKPGDEAEEAPTVSSRVSGTGGQGLTSPQKVLILYSEGEYSMDSIKLAEQLIAEYDDNTGVNTPKTSLRDKSRLLQWYYTYKASLVCEECGFDFEGRPECCDFHHIDPNNKSKSVSYLAQGGYSKNEVLAEIKKCRALCANCHRTEHWTLNG